MNVRGLIFCHLDPIDPQSRDFVTHLDIPNCVKKSKEVIYYIAIPSE